MGNPSPRAVRSCSTQINSRAGCSQIRRVQGVSPEHGHADLRIVIGGWTTANEEPLRHRHPQPKTGLARESCFKS